MDKIYRDGADIAIAFASGRRRNAIVAAATLISEKVSTPEQLHVLDVVDASPDVAATLPRGRIKLFLRRIAQRIFRLVRPLVKPVALRARGFMMTGQLQQLGCLHAETIQKFEETEQSLRSEIKASLAMIRMEGQNTRNALIAEMKYTRDTLNAALIAEMKYTRELLHQAESDRQSRAQVEVLRNQQRLELVETYAAAAARRNAVQCGENEILVRTAVGYMLCPAQDYALLAQLLDVGELEAGTRMLIQRVLRPGDSYVDVGANIGMHTVAAARAMQGKGSIVCFEPYAPTARLLEKSVFLNGYKEIVEVHRAAVATQSGSQPLYLGNTSGHHSLFSLPREIASEAPPEQTGVVSLDEIFPPGRRVDLIKIDVEGAELDVLDGASRLLNENPDAGLIVECGPAHLLRVGIRLEDWLGRFQSAGFGWKAIDPDDGHLEAWSIERISDSSSINLFMARADASVWRLAEHADE